ncbi:MAG: hypothetical protein SF052_06370 [Bacteroidia bacterium]|nr:hypothetical protein [Bacteroidia bacterium]
MKGFYFLFILFLFCIGNLSAQLNSFKDQTFRAEADKGLRFMYNMEFDRAEWVFNKLKNQHPEHPAGYFLLGMNRYWQTYISETTPDFYDYTEKQLLLSLEKNKKLEKIPTAYPEYIFFEFMNNALVARLYALRRNWLPAVNAARKTLTPVKAGLKLTKDAPEIYFLAGIYHYYVATYHNYYPLVRPFLAFFPDGNEQLGLEEIETAGRISNFTQREANFFLIYIYLDETKRLDKGLTVAKSLSQEFPMNTWFQADYARGLIKNHRYTEGEKILLEIQQKFELQSGWNSRMISSIESRYQTFLMIKAYHYLAITQIYLHKDYTKAMSLLKKSNDMARIAGVKEDNYLAGNEYYAGVCYDNLKKREEALTAYHNTLSMAENTEYKDLAKVHLKTPHTPETIFGK